MVTVQVVPGSLILTPLNTKEECLEMFKNWLENKDKSLTKYLDYVEHGSKIEDDGKSLYFDIMDKE